MACSKQLGLEITDDEGCFNRINAVVSAAAEDKADTIRLGGSYGGSEIGDAALAVVLCGMHNNTSVTSLDLSMDGITDQGLEALAAHLRDNTCNNLLDISLDGNLFTSAGVASLSAALIHSAASVLMRLDLSSSSIGDEGASSIANVLASPSSPPLAALYLRECGIGNVGCKMLCAALKNNSVLHTLHLSGNSIADQSVADICETAVVSLSLLELNFASMPTPTHFAPPPHSSNAQTTTSRMTGLSVCARGSQRARRSSQYSSAGTGPATRS